MISTVLGLEDDVKNVTDKLSSKADKTSLEELMTMISNTRNDVEKCNVATSENTSQLEELKKSLSLLDVKIAELSKELAKLKNTQGSGSTVVHSTGVEQEELDRLRNAIEKLRIEMDDTMKTVKELERLKELKRLVKRIEISLDKKLDREEFEKWKAENDINEIIDNLVKRFADRNEIMKLIKKLENRIAILETMTNDAHANELGDSALLAKKPLGGWSCASCQKDLVNIEGMRVQYYPWAKLPQRDPERIAKVGQGYSRMLSLMKPELTRSQPTGLTMKKSYEEEVQMVEERHKPMVRSYAQGFNYDTEGRRSSKGNALPNIQQKVCFFAIY